MSFAFFPKQNHASGSTAIPQLARFLIDDHATLTGPTSGWTVIDTYSSNASTPHEVPSTATNMDSLGADNGWRTNSIATGDYIILQSGDGANQFQIGIEYQSTILMRFIIAPFGGFDTANNNNDMTNAANWTAVKSDDFDFTIVSGAANWTVRADDAGFDAMFICENGATRAWTYIGKLLSADAAGDDHPVVWYDTETVISGSSTQGVTGDDWNRVSAVDNTTIIELAGLFLNHSTLSQEKDNVSGLSDDAVRDGNFHVDPLWLSSDTVGHYGRQGRVNGVYIVDRTASGVGTSTFNDQAYACIKTSGTQAGVLFDWDGATDL